MNNRKIAINLFLSFLAAIFFYFAYFIFPIFIWVAFVPFVLLVWYNHFKNSFWFFLLIAFLISVSSGYWVVAFDKKFFYLFIVYISSFFVLYGSIMALAFSKLRNNFSFLVPGVVYIFIFWLYSINGIGEYFFNVAVLQPRFAAISQILGENGLIFVILTVNALIAFLIIKRKNKINIFILLFLVLILSIGNYYATHKIPDGRRIRVAIVQGAFSGSWSWRADNAGTQVLERYTELSRQVAKEKPDLIVWPEYAIPVNLESQPEVYEKISSLARELKVNMIIGAMSNDGIAGEGEEQQYFNSAYGFDRNGNSLGRYDTLRPFNFKSQRSIGEGYWIFNTDVGKIGSLICYDEVFGKISRDYEKLGVDFLVAISNNEPTKSYLTRFWQKRFSELRAATNKKYYVRSTNTGFSQVVNPYGVVIKTLPGNLAGATTVDIYLSE